MAIREQMKKKILNAVRVLSWWLRRMWVGFVLAGSEKWVVVRGWGVGRVDWLCIAA